MSNVRLPTRRRFLRRAGEVGVAAAITPKELFSQGEGGLSHDSGPKEIAGFISEHKEDVDWAKIWDRDIPVLFVGERHTVLSDKDEIIQQLPKLKKLGMTHLAMEMLKKGDEQKKIDGYRDGTVSREEILAIFKRDWDKGPGVPEKYMELVDAAIKNDIQILAINPVIDPSVGRLERFKRQNESWAETIRDTVTNQSDARVLVYGGAGHSGYNVAEDSANEILRKHWRISSRVVDFAGGEEAREDPYTWELKLARAANDLEIHSSRFGIRMEHRSQKDARPADYFIHLPQTEKRVPVTYPE